MAIHTDTFNWLTIIKSEKITLFHLTPKKYLLTYANQ